MKRRSLILSLAAGLTVLVLSSYKDGPAASHGLNRSGGGGSPATCNGGGCHSSATGATVVTGLTLTDQATSTLVTDGKYLPGHNYTVGFAATNSSSQPKYGFQFSVTNASSASTGTLVASASSTHVSTVSGISIVEHSTPLSGVSGVYANTFTWTAPATGTGTITFFGVVNAVNGTNTASGDQPSAGFTQSFTEGIPAGIADAALNGPAVYPNPAADVLHISLQQSGNYELKVIDLNGRVVMHNNLQSVGSELVLPVGNLVPGAYLLNVNGAGTSYKTVSFVKK